MKGRRDGTMIRKKESEKLGRAGARNNTKKKTTTKRDIITEGRMGKKQRKRGPYCCCWWRRWWWWVSGRCTDRWSNRRNKWFMKRGGGLERGRRQKKG